MIYSYRYAYASSLTRLLNANECCFWSLSAVAAGARKLNVEFIEGKGDFALSIILLVAS